MMRNGLYPRVGPLWPLLVVLLVLPTIATRIVDCRYRAQNGRKRAKTRDTDSREEEKLYHAGRRWSTMSAVVPPRSPRPLLVKKENIE